MSGAIRRFGLAVLVAALVGASVTPVAAATDWGVRIDGNTVGAQIISNPGSTVRLQLVNRTAVVETDPYVTALLKAIGLDTGYSQTASWTTGDGPALACPTPVVNYFCWSSTTGGKVVIIRSVRAILLASAPENPGTTQVTVGITTESIEVDVALAAIAVALDAIGGGFGKALSAEALALVFELFPEAVGFKDAMVAGDYAAAKSELEAFATRVAAVIIEHAASWGLSALVSKLVPQLFWVQLAIAVAKVAPALVNLFVASQTNRHSTISVQYGPGAGASPAGGSGGANLEWAGTAWVADWSGGLDGWTAGSGWTVVGGMLVSDGSRTDILAPYEPPGTLFAVEAEAQIVRVLNAGSLTGRADMGLLVRAGPGGGGFVAGYCASALVIIPCSDTGEDQGIYTSSGERLESSSATRDDGWHIYLLVVRDNTLTLSIDGATVAQATDNRYLDGTRVGFHINGIEVSIRSFRVLSP